LRSIRHLRRAGYDHNEAMARSFGMRENGDIILLNLADVEPSSELPCFAYSSLKATLFKDQELAEMDATDEDSEFKEGAEEGEDDDASEERDGAHNTKKRKLARSTSASRMTERNERHGQPELNCAPQQVVHKPTPRTAGVPAIFDQADCCVFNFTYYEPPQADAVLKKVVSGSHLL
jgi:hypothetical protein